ncbi:zinc finger BED domain-containing protein 1-like [Aplysia californica]|uniref:Zinc finger BED domain-containing protein 1-like n=1 Tax=Aplysia californica TaxID=6500 RepID=A0ABM1VS04_APLCA|nr:zinc finger BED domain-containing protein 1-like [Aplysia californica]
MMSSKKSLAWDFFKKKDGLAVCNVCQTKYKFQTTTTSLIYHIRKKHPTLLGDNESSGRTGPPASGPSSATAGGPPSIAEVGATARMTQPTIQQSIESRRLYPLTSPRAQALDMLVAEMVCLDLQPFSVTEDRGFRRLINALDPGTSYQAGQKSPGPKMYCDKIAEVMMALANTSAVALTADMWTSRATQGYLTVTAHCLSPHWQLQSFVLNTVRMADSHTADNITQELKRIIKRRNIQDKVNVEVTDNGQNMVRAVTQIPLRQFSCFGHTINLEVNDALGNAIQLTETRKKARDKVSYFHHSTKAADYLREQQKGAHAQKALKLSQEVPTRWNSTLFMLERYIQLHTQITTALSLQSRQHKCLSNSELVFISDAARDLRPFEKATRETSDEHFPTIAMCLPLVNLLLQSAKAVPKTGLNDLLLASHCNRLKNHEKIFLWAASTFLDPRFKKHAFLDNTAVQEISSKMAKRLAKPTAPPTTAVSSSDDQTTESNVPSESIWKAFDLKIQNVLKTTANPHIRPQTEMRRHLEEDPIPRTDDPLFWWRAHEGLFPELSKLAKKYLCIPATSVPSERLFSTAGELISQKGPT